MQNFSRTMTDNSKDTRFPKAPPELTQRSTNPSTEHARKVRTEKAVHSTHTPQGKLRTWARELRLPFTTASIVPILLGTAIAWALTQIPHWGLFLLTLIGGVCIHLGANVANDYFDHRSGTDDINVEFVRPFTGGSRMIQLGLLSPRAVLTGALVLFTLGGTIGLFLTITRGIWVLVLGVIGVFSGFFYTAPPFKLASRGIGELSIGLGFGILLTLGAFYVQLQFLAVEPILAAIPVALLIAAVLYINEFQDSAADEATGKRTLVVRLGRRRAAIGYAAILAAVYLSIILSIAIHAVSPYAVIGLSSLPVSVLGIRYALAAYDRPFELVPANILTVLNHLFTGLALTIGYLLQGLAIPYSYLVVTGSLLLVVATILCRKIASQTTAARKLGKKPVPPR